MDGVELLPVEIAEALERGATVVTGNQRAARALQRGFDRRNRQRGLSNWTPAVVLSWDAWMAALWHKLLVAGRVTQLLLNRSQEHAVWRSILETDKDLASLRSPDALAELAAETWQRLCDYEGRHRLRGATWHGDARAFQRWALNFEIACKTQDLIATAQLEEALRVTVEGGEIEIVPRDVALVGFDEMTPAQAALVMTMRSVGIRIQELHPAISLQQQTLVAAVDEDDELQAAARWVRRFVEERPDAKIAVIVPALDAQRSEIDRVFREILAPELQDIRAGDDIGPYEFSLGSSLAETPMVATALDLLRWTVGALPLERVSRLLLSPYFAMSGDERGVRAEFDAFELRRARTLRPEISLDGLVSAVERSRRRDALSRFLKTLRETRTVANRLQGMDARAHAEWAERMREMLAAARWRPEEQETSVEFQTRRKWESALDELATLDFDGATIELEEALSTLQQIARQTTFAPESREAPVQVMGPLEAAGGTFDAAWFLRAGELSWPLDARSSPLLPWSLQSELQMPGTDVSRGSELAGNMTKRIAQSASVAIFSYAKLTDTGKQRPSAALAGLSLKETTTVEIAGAASKREAVELESIEDIARVQPLPDVVIRGGARILELQAACGFRAFAEQRLWATELDSIEPGMDARESGTVVHEVLELFWNSVKTQSALKSMTTDERNEVLEWCITQALRRTEASSVTTWDAAYLHVQRGRLHRLIGWWLDLEAERRLPFAVRLSEKEFKDVHVGPLRLSVRMDRVDEVEGGEILIDYKTGLASPNDWLTDRPDAPQLPLYSILSDANALQGVAFGLVRAGEGRGMKGYATQNGVLPGRSTRMKEAATLGAQVERWRQVLTVLAEEFYSGDAQVRPKSYPTTCEHCAQRLLCRLDVSSLEEDDDADSTDEVELG
jgi:ATP-dependent helicase/nuclease subunit B